jgi:hypothetical protein
MSAGTGFSVPMNGCLRTLHRRRFLWIGLAVLLLLNIGNAASIHLIFVKKADFAFGVVPLFNFDREANLPTLFNGLLLAFASWLAFGISGCLKTGGTSRHVLSWKAVGFVLLFMMLDELCRVHEALDWILMARLETEGAIAWPWVIPYAVLALCVAGFFLRFFLSLQPKYRWCFAVSAVLYVIGAIGFELLEAAHVEKHGIDSMGFGILYSIEENLEMLAVMLAIWGFMGYAVEHCRGLGVSYEVKA